MFDTFAAATAFVREHSGSEVKSLPTSLKDVLDALADDHQFLLQGAVFDEHLIQEWIQTKQQELLDVEAYSNPYEVQLYFDI